MARLEVSTRLRPPRCLRAEQAGLPHPMGVAMVDDEEDACLMAESIVAKTRWLVWLGSCPSGDKAVAAIPSMKPTVVLMDIRMPGMNGFECARRLLALAPTLIIVMVTAWGEVANLEQGLRLGATAFLCKPYTPAQLLATIRFSVKPTWPLRFMNGLSGDESGSPSRSIVRLTSRQFSLMRLLAQGFLYKEMADKLGMSYSAVHRMLHRVYHNLHVTNRTEAIRKLESAARDLLP